MFQSLTNIWTNFIYILHICHVSLQSNRKGRNFLPQWYEQSPFVYDFSIFSLRACLTFQSPSAGANSIIYIAIRGEILFGSECPLIRLLFALIWNFKVWEMRFRSWCNFDVFPWDWIVSREMQTNFFLVNSVKIVDL